MPRAKTKVYRVVRTNLNAQVYDILKASGTKTGDTQATGKLIQPAQSIDMVLNRSIQ